MSEVQIEQSNSKDPSQYGIDQGWGARRARVHLTEKNAMAKYCILHDFLVRRNPNEPRDTVASILVNQGTTPNVVVDEGLKWIGQHWDSDGPFDITWYTTGGLANSTLHEFRSNHKPQLSIAAQNFLFPGRVNTDLQAVAGPEAEQFVENLDTDFTYAFLSAYAFDIDAGRTHFLYSEELRLQRALAMLYAHHKFLFLDRSKFKREGKRGYKVLDVLETSRVLTIYTTTSDNASQEDTELKDRFKDLCSRLISKPHTGNNGSNGTNSNGSNDSNNNGSSLTSKELRLREVRLRIIKPTGELVAAEQEEGYLLSENPAR